MNRHFARAVALIALVSLVGACAAAAAPVWTFPPAASSSAGPAASTPAAPVDPAASHPASGTIEIEAFDLGFTPAAISVEAAGTYTVKLSNTGTAPHDVTFAGRHDDRRRRRPERRGHGRRPRRRPGIHLLDPGPRVRRDEGRGLRRGGCQPGRRRPRRAGARHRRRGRSECPRVRALRREGAGPAVRRRPRHRPRHDRGSEDGRGGLRPEGLDVRRDRPWPCHPGEGGRHDPGPPQERGREPAEPLDRLPRQPGRLERRDDLDRPGRGEALRVDGRLRRRLDVPLRHDARAPPHRQRDVRHGHRRTEGGPAGGRPRVRDRPERVVPGRAGQGGRPREGDGRRAGARRRPLQRRRQPVSRPSARGRDRRRRPGLLPQRRAERRQLVPRRRDDLQHGHQGRRGPDEGQRRQLGQPRRSISRRPRARSSSSRPPRTGSTRS